MSTGGWIAVGAIVLALGFGCFRALTDGRFRGTHRLRSGVSRASDLPVGDTPGGPDETSDARETPKPVQGPGVHDLLPAGTPLGERATLVQFSSAFCAPCRVTRRVLAGVADAQPGVVHVELDAEHHLDLVRRLGVLRTPTTLVLDASGREVARAGGAPRPEQVVAALPGE